MKYKYTFCSLVLLFYIFFVGQNVIARVCEDQVGRSGQSDCPDNKDHCTDPLWREFMEEQCPVTCGICAPTAQVENGIYDDPKLISSINQDLDPCENFYKYICDGFLKNNAMLISRERPRIDQMTYWYKELNDRQFAIIENNRLTPENEEDNYIQQMYLFYDTCRDEAGRRRENSRAVLNKIWALKSSPNALLAFNTDFLINTNTMSSRAEFETPDPLGINQPIPSMPFYSYFTYTDLRNTSRGIFYLLAGGGPRFFIDPMFDKAKENFKNYLRSIIKLLIEDESATGSHRVFAQPVGGNWSTEIERRVENFMTVETTRAKVFSPPEGQLENQEEMEKQRIEMEANPYKFISYVNVAEIKQYLTSFDLAQFWSAIISTETLSSRGLLSIGQIDVMITFPLKNLKEYEDMILSLSPQAVSDYLEWFILLNHVSILDDRYRALTMDFAGQNIQARFDCKTQTFKYFPHQGDRLYAETFFPEDVRTSVTEIFDYIDEAFGDMLEELDWMDDDTRDEALDKLDAMEIHIGYVDEIFDDERIEEIYEGYDLRAGMSYVDMVTMMDEWRAKYELEKLAEIPPFYNSASQVISAYYVPDRNLFNGMNYIV